MRLFVAVPLADDVCAAVLECIDRLRRDAARRAPASRLSWNARERLHVTVRFIGAVDDDTAARVAGVLRPPLDLPPFDAFVEGVGAFPPAGPPRVVWAGIGGGADRLGDVERVVGDRLAAAGIAREDRPYRPHVTLARVRDAAGLRRRGWLDGCADVSFGTTRVDAITLFESRPSPKGPTYVPLQRTGLIGEL